MAQTEDVVILRVDTGEAVKNVGDLRTNIKELKERISTLDIGTKAYQDTLKELQVNQNALKGAMNATSVSMDEVSTAARGATTSYNGLVNKMAELKKEWRATGDEAERAKLGKQIAEINQQLKDMDASVGNFSRNVGNYESGVTGIVARMDEWGETLKHLPPTLGSVKEKVGQVGETMQLVGKNPLMGTIGLLAPIILRIASALQENETAMGAVNKAMSALQPVFDLASSALEKIAGWVSQAVDYFISLAGESGGTFKNIISGAIGVGNVILQTLLTPVRNTIELFKGLGNVVKSVFQGDFAEAKESAKEALAGIGESFKKGFSFSDNFNVGKAIAERMIEAPKQAKTKTESVKAGEKVAESFVSGLEKGIKDGIEDIDVDAEIERAIAEMDAEIQKAWDKSEQTAQNKLGLIDKWSERQLRLNNELTEDTRVKEDREYEIISTANQRKLDLLRQYSQEALDMGNLDAHLEYEQQIADLSVEIMDDQMIRRKKLRDRDEEDEEDWKKNILAITMAAASATSQIMSGIADSYEENGVANVREAKKIKNLRVASATLDMLQGAVTAYSSAQTLGPIAGPIVGGINAAAVLALGAMQISKIKQVAVDGASSQTPSASAQVSAPKIETSLPSVRTLTTASEEERLNRMATTQESMDSKMSQRVYILQSDIEAAGQQSKVAIQESSF